MSFSESGMTSDQERMFPDQVCLFQNQECMFPDWEMWTFPNKNKYLKPNFLIANIILMHKFIQIRMRQDSLCVQPRQLCLTFTSIYEQIFLQIVSTRGNTISHLFTNVFCEVERFLCFYHIIGFVGSGSTAVVEKRAKRITLHLPISLPL